MKAKCRIIAVITTLVLAIGMFGFGEVSVSAEEDYTPILKVKKINDGTGVKITISNIYMDKYYGYYVYVSSADMYKGYESVSGDTCIKGLYEEDIKKNNTFSFKVDGMQPGTYYFRVETSGWGDSKRISKAKKVKIAKVNTTDKPIPENVDLASIEKGDTFFMGYYEQNGDMTDGREPIEWIVLSKTDSKALIISKYVLDILPYNITEDKNTTWESCTIRQWLNKVFYKEAFSKSEKSKILKSKLKTSGTEYGAGGCTTKDKVFLLSYEEATSTKLFKDKSYRRVRMTPYCGCRGASETDISGWLEDSSTDAVMSICWLLRGTRGYPWEACTVHQSGEVINVGDCFVDHSYGIRPAMYIKIK
ncbi:MAG: DUF6273 domain-containing protein [Lachnospiraceae bacterium]|nr:DUF6273 domain-containing protein [Lachnospiraceae bacterium]